MGLPSGDDLRTRQLQREEDDVLRARQLVRERSQREAALGKRASSVLRGDMGPVLRRWVAGSVLPVSRRTGSLAAAILAGRYDEAADLAQSPVFGLPEMTASMDLAPALRWFLKPCKLAQGGNADDGCLGDDLTLAVMGVAISTLATSDGPVPLTRIVMAAGDAARETCLGQFITQVQGAKAMLKVRTSGKAAWKQHRALDGIASMMAGQVRSALGDEPEVPIRGKSVVSILNQAGELRRIDLRRPTPEDWQLLEMAREVRGEGDPHAQAWGTFAMLILCAAQAESGWFDLVATAPKRASIGRRTRRRAHGLVLSDDAYAAIQGDLDRWLSMGFISEPMLVPPVKGDYLSVKHRPVTGGRGPMGLKTDAEGTTAWEVASEVMAGTAWTVPGHTLRALRESPLVQSLAADCEPNEVRREGILNAYRGLAQDQFYMPLFMDFRGRIYPKPNVVSYQGSDLQKALLVFPQGGEQAQGVDARIMHTANLYGNGLDKAPYLERVAWWRASWEAWAAAICGRWEAPALQDLLAKADKPLQLLTALGLGTTESDRMACQIDGTCNGLQHLSALFRDETAAPFVNLVESSLEDRPGDIYLEVAYRVAARLALMDVNWARRVRACIKLDRKLCKKPVMVLPYGGTRSTVEDAVLTSILEQNPDPSPWTHGWDASPERIWFDWVEGNYSAFKDRELKDHPLLHLDAKRLAGVLWECIEEVLPRPMAAMQAFRDIAKKVGERTLEWSTGFGKDPLWVVQAKAKSAASRLHFRGLHLPGSVRGLQMRAGKDEIDPQAHTSGIVANFIHSQDGSHLARTMENLVDENHPATFGANHDCFITRPSLMGSLSKRTRSAFAIQYICDPLDQACLLRDPRGDACEAFPSWYALADSLGVSFPEKGRWKPEEVLGSAWFFS